MVTSYAQENINHIPLKPGGDPQENFMEERGAHYYKIKVDSSYQSGQDLVISVKGVDSRSDPDLYISSTNEQPTNRDNSEYA